MITNFTCQEPDDGLLDGTEVWPIIGTAITEQERIKIFHSLKGLKIHWNCIEKAIITRDILGKGVVVIGDLMIVSGDLKSEYGFYFNPPYEFHAWVQLPTAIIDVSLPGVIDKGINTHDAFGPFLVGREPAILAGVPLPWMKYSLKEVQS